MTQDNPKEDIKICPRCGSRNVSGLKHLANWVKRSPHSTYSCQDCGYEGIPVLLDSKEDYRKYLEKIGKK